MAEPESQTLRGLRDIRAAIKAPDQKNEKRFDSMDGRFDTADKDMAKLRSRFDNLRRAMTGESILGHYATAEFDERLQSLEERMKALESQR